MDNVTKLRISAHSLPIERGRHSNIQRQNRVCDICTDAKIGDEYHILMECPNPNLMQIRKTFFAHCTRRVPQIQLLNARDTFLYICNLSDNSLLDITVHFMSDCLDAYDKSKKTDNSQ